MWLISAEPHLQFTWFNDPDDVEGGYAVLSHVWRRDGDSEQSFEEVLRLMQELATLDDDRLNVKVRECWHLAQAYGFSWIWVDAPCINQKNSAEVSEAITSMYKWYARASICFAHLPDVPASDTIRAPHSAFRKSVYFSRGWTLQELLAPCRVVFVADDWTVIGEKVDLADVLEEITGIDQDVLTFHRRLSDVSVARRLSWASRRETTRVEDKAYCLLGLFGIRMPLMYGEGDDAFVRLQRILIVSIPDHSLLAWRSVSGNSSTDDAHRSLPASLVSTALFPRSPAAFASASHMIAVDREHFLAAVVPLCVASYEDHKLFPRIGLDDPYGVKCRLPVLFDGPNPLAALLACQEDSYRSSSFYIALALERAGRGVYRVGARRVLEGPAQDLRPQTSRLFRVNLDLIDPPLFGISRILRERPAFHVRFMSFRITNDYDVADMTPSSSISIPRWLPFKFFLSRLSSSSSTRARAHTQTPAVPVVDL